MGTVIVGMWSEIYFLHFEVATWCQGSEGRLEDGERVPEAGEEGATVDIIER